MNRVVSRRDKNELREHLRRHFLGQPEVVFAYLHGSFVADLPYRDIDVAVYLKPLPADSLEYRLAVGNELTLRLGFPVDVQVLNDASPAFRYSVTRGQLLFSRDEVLRGLFCERTWREYLDFLPFLKDNLRELYQGFGKGRKNGDQ